MVEQSRGSSFFSLQLDKSIWKRSRIAYHKVDNFKNSEDVREFIRFLNNQGVAVYNKNKEYLSKIFSNTDAIIETKHPYFSGNWYCIEPKTRAVSS
jgi:hypothetical protein